MTSAEQQEGDQSPAALRRRISDLEERLSRLEEAETRFLLFAESSQDYAFITIGTNGRVVWWNRGAFRMFGYEEEEIIGEPAAIFFTPEDRTRGEPERELATALRDGRAEDERWHLRKDGSRFWGSGVVTLLHTHSGEFCGFAKVMRDRTEQKRAEWALRDSEERCRLLIENVTDTALFQLDAEGRISDWNRGAERIFGYREEEIVGRPFEILAPDAECAARLRSELSMVQEKGAGEDEQWLSRKDGTSLFARWVTNRVKDEHGQFRGFVKVLRDETNRKLADDEREREQQRQREALRGQIAVTGEALDRTKEELRSLAARLLTIQEDERRRIARDLHDDLAQRLALVEIGIDQIRGDPNSGPAYSNEELAAVKTQVTSLADDVRKLSHRLHPAILDDLGLEAGIQSLCRDFGDDIVFSAAELPKTISTDVRTALYRIAQEAMSNVRKHGLSPLTVSLKGEGNAISLTVQDSGPGLDVQAARKNRGLGIISMQERALSIGATFKISSSPGTPTIVSVLAPAEHRL